MRRNTGTAHLTALLAALGTACLHRAAAGRTRRDRADGRRIRRADLSHPRHVFRIEPLEPRWADGCRYGGHESCGLAALSEYDLRRGRAARAVRRWRANAALEREGTASGRTRRRRHFRGRTLQADMHFHVAGLAIPYQVRYVAVAGGSAFYLKTGVRRGNLPAVHDQSATDANLEGRTLRHKEKEVADGTAKYRVVIWYLGSFAVTGD